MSDTAELIEHVQDSDVFKLPFGLEDSHPPALRGVGPAAAPDQVHGLGVDVAVLMVAIFVPLARRAAKGGRPRGRWWNMFEAVVLFIRDRGGAAVDRPPRCRSLSAFLWTMFFFILFLNLIGLVPWGGSPTGAMGVTVGLAAITFITVIGAGMAKLWPAGVLDRPGPAHGRSLCHGVVSAAHDLFAGGAGALIRHAILAVRLFANMFAGHLVLAVVTGFIAAAAPTLAWYGVMPSSVLGAVALCLLELLVALIQAYVFTFLAALFIGMAVHQH